MPKQDGKYLFKDYETTLDYIKKASGNTVKSEAPLFALWILPRTTEDLGRLVEQYLNDVA